MVKTTGVSQILSTVDSLLFWTLPSRTIIGTFFLKWTFLEVSFTLEIISKTTKYNIQGAPIKNNPLGKINYLSYFNIFFHQIYSFYRGGFKAHKQQISLQYLL